MARGATVHRIGKAAGKAPLYDFKHLIMVSPCWTEKATPQAVDSELARENERLRARLSEAGEKTTQLGERVRFLRQQIGQGAER